MADFGAREQALAHQERSRTIRAYRRSDLLEPRSELMQHWADFVTSKAGPQRFQSRPKLAGCLWATGGHTCEWPLSPYQPHRPALRPRVRLCGGRAARLGAVRRAIQRSRNSLLLMDVDLAGRDRHRCPISLGTMSRCRRRPVHRAPATKRFASCLSATTARCRFTRFAPALSAISPFRLRRPRRSEWWRAYGAARFQSPFP